LPELHRVPSENPRQPHRQVLPQMKILLALLFPLLVSAQDVADFYKRSCAACHSIGGGRRLGPDLKDLESRKDRKWLTDFLVDPKGTLDQADPYGKQILDESKGMVMPKINGVDRAMAEALLDYVAAQSKGAANPAPPAPAPPPSPTPAAESWFTGYLEVGER